MPIKSRSEMSCSLDTCDGDVNGAFGQHPRLEELHVSVLVARHFSIDCWRRDVDLSLPTTEHLQGLVLDHGAVHSIPLGSGFHDLQGSKLCQNFAR